MTHTDAFKIVFAIASEQSDAQFFAELSELIERKTARLTYLKRLDLIEWADKYGDAAASFKMIVETLMKNDYTRKRYNPIKEYFNELPPYDPNEGDYIQQLLSFITVPSERKRFDVQMKKALVRTVACALRVIRFNKECIILQGKQDDGKSSFLSSLMPKSLGTKYYYDAFNPENKDDVKRMAMCLLINIDEMASLSKKDINQIKSKMTMESVKMRLPYDARDSDLPRAATFFGTTNEEEFLTDVTGNARWIVFKVLSINHDYGGPKGYSQIPIDRVWAQALYLLRNGFDFKMTIDDKKEADTVNRRYQITTAEQEYIQRYFEPDETKTSCFQTTEMVEYIRSQYVKDISLNSINFGKALTHLKFERGEKYHPQGSKTQAKVVYAKLIDRDAPTEPTPSVQSSVLDNRQAFKKQMEANMTGGDHEQRERMIENARKHLKKQKELMEEFTRDNAPTAVLNHQEAALRDAEVALMQLDKDAVKEIPF